MGIQERRDIEKKERKKKIMTAAITIIEQEGYEKLSIRKIADKIEYSPTMIYLYYKDKAEIIADMSEELYKKVMEGVIAFINENPSMPLDKLLHNVLHIFIKILCGEPEMAKAIMYRGADVIFSNDHTGETPDNPGIHMLDQILSKGISQETFRPGIENTSWMIVSALLGFTMSSIASQLYLLDHFDQLIDNYVELLMKGIMQ